MLIPTFTKFFFISLFCFYTFGQVQYQGPAAGSVDSGVIVNTDNFFRSITFGDPEEKGIRNTVKPEFEPMVIDFPVPAPQEGSNYFEDPSVSKVNGGGNDQTVLLNSFPGLPMGNSIPPDPYIAAGPNHIIATVNSRFAIWDKQGNMLENIDGDQWYSSALAGASVFDPKVVYDHIAERWIMVWLHQNEDNQTGYYLLSVSDDSDPLGTWYNWVLPSNKNGNTVVNNWGDYQGVGYDSLAIYFCSNQFSFGAGQFQYGKIRIIAKDQLYNNTADSVGWSDIWDITYPTNAVRVFTVRPANHYSSSTEHYFLHAPGGGGNFVTLFRLSNPLTAPTLTGVNVPVTFFASAPNANQLGGSTILIEGGGSHFRNEPTYKDGFLWAVHSVRNPTSPTYSSLNYLKIDVSTNTAIEDVAFGADGYWHIYPALAIDQDQNIAITYSRSGDSSYIGAFYTTRLSSDPPGLDPSTALMEGNGNYVVDFGTGRNRWGDYNGIWTDPADPSNIWMFTEYVATTNTWGTWVGEIRLVPFPGAFVFTNTPVLDFGNVESTFISDTLTAFLANYGEDDLEITSVADSVGPFHLISSLIYPLVVASYDSIYIDFVFSPASSGPYEELISVSSNDPNFTGYTLKGNGYEINPAATDLVYASTGGGNNGDMLTINLSTGAGTLIGPSLFTEVKSISIHPVTKTIYGIVTSPTETQLVRVNALNGDSYVLHNLLVPQMAGIAFDTTGLLLGVARTGEIYQIDYSDGNAVMISDAGINVSGVAINPLTNELWVSVLVIVGANKDRIVKIDVSTGDTTIVGNTGLNLVNNDIEFDGLGNFYAVTGSTNQNNNLIQIDTTNAAGTILGSTGFNNVTGLAYLPSGTTSVDDEITKIPSSFNLSQNYPNPFNPSTVIDFALPVPSDIKLTIYNLLGEVVVTLLDNNLQSGYHKIDWNSIDQFGKRVSSGIYFYELRAKGNNGENFSKFKKMVLLK